MKTTAQPMETSRGNYNANNIIIFSSDGRIFQSYRTTIAIIDNNNTVTLDETYWNYSVITGKYRNKFLGETKADTQKKIDSGEYKLANLND